MIEILCFADLAAHRLYGTASNGALVNNHCFSQFRGEGDRLPIRVSLDFRDSSHNFGMDIATIRLWVHGRILRKQEIRMSAATRAGVLKF